MPHTRRPFHGPWIIAACFFTFGIASGFPLMAADLFGLRSLGRAVSGILPSDTEKEAEVAAP